MEVALSDSTPRAVLLTSTAHPQHSPADTPRRAIQREAGFESRVAEHPPSGSQLHPDRRQMTASTVATSKRKKARRANRAEARALAADPLLTAEEAAAEAGRALSTFWRDVKRGTLPPPYYVTPRAPRWRVSELRAVVEAAPRAPRAA